jgi:hypothetical protein
VPSARHQQSVRTLGDLPSGRCCVRPGSSCVRLTVAIVRAASSERRLCDERRCCTRITRVCTWSTFVEISTRDSGELAHSPKEPFADREVCCAVSLMRAERLCTTRSCLLQLDCTGWNGHSGSPTYAQAWSHSAERSCIAGHGWRGRLLCGGSGRHRHRMSRW